MSLADWMMLWILVFTFVSGGIILGLMIKAFKDGPNGKCLLLALVWGGAMLPMWASCEMCNKILRGEASYQLQQQVDGTVVWKYVEKEKK